MDYWNKGERDRERDQRDDDRATREQFERRSPKMVTSRVDIVGRLNAIARADAAHRAPAVERLDAIRKAQQNSSYTPDRYQQFKKMAEEAFNRLHHWEFEAGGGGAATE